VRAVGRGSLGNAVRHASLLIALLAGCRYDLDKIPSFPAHLAADASRDPDAAPAKPEPDDAANAPPAEASGPASDSGAFDAGDASPRMDAEVPATSETGPPEAGDGETGTGPQPGCDAGFIEATTPGDCEDIDECLQTGICPPDDFCVNTPGGHDCMPCPAGYQRVLDRCENIDECAGGERCDSEAFCSDREGGYDCRCPAYYTDPGPIPGRQCLDKRRKLLAAFPDLSVQLFMLPVGEEYLLAIRLTKTGTMIDGVHYAAEDEDELLIARLDADLGLLWLHRRPGIKNLLSAVVDSRGDLVVSGKGTSGLDLGEGPIDGGGAVFQFVARYGGVDGAPLWSEAVHGAHDGAESRANVDKDDNVLLCGVARGSLQIDQTTHAFAASVYLVKFSHAGEVLFARAWFGTASKHCETVASDSDGEIFIGGDFYDSIVFDETLTAPLGNGAFVAKLSASGTLRWAKQLSTTGDVSLNDLAVDQQGDLIVVGSFRGTFDAGDQEYRSFGTDDAFIVGRSADDGAPSWSLRIGAKDSDVARAVAVGPAGEFVVVGDSSGPNGIDFGEGLRAVGQTGQGFVQKYDAGHGLLWTGLLGGIAADMIDRVVVDEHGRILVTSAHVIAPDNEGMLDALDGTLVSWFEP
jgi:hypothetical protein